MMERLTTDEPVKEMSMYELAHNSCYIDENLNARYRDFETDIDTRELTRKLMVAFGQWKTCEECGLEADNEMIDDDIFDDTMLDYLGNYSTAITGLIALFYRNLWAMADLRERLKYYEDLEEQGLLLKLPCKVGRNLYDITEFIEGYDSPDIFLIDTSRIEISKDKEGLIYTIDCVDYREKDFGTTLFTSEDEALKAIREKGWIL